MKPTLLEYLPADDARAILKLAEVDDESVNKRRLKAVLKGVAGMGLGTLAGAGAAHYADKAVKHFTGKPIPHTTLLTAAPILGAGLGLAYNLAQGQQQKEMSQRVGEGSHDSSERSVPAR